jgi:A/G-specific adenine glycosylase
MKELNSLGLRWRSEELHNLSCQIVKKYDGIIPRNKEKLLQLPGIGPYISSAILNFAFDKPEPMLDTNSVRVIGRFFGLSINDSSRRSKQFEKIMKDFVSFKEHKKIMWNLIDFAYFICKPQNPVCNKCPLNKKCCFLRESV